VLQETVQLFAPDGALDASRPLMLLVLGTAHVPPPFNKTSVTSQEADAVAEVVEFTTDRIAGESPEGPAGPDAPVAPCGPCGPAAPVTPMRPWQSRASHVPSPLMSSAVSQTPFALASQHALLPDAQ